MKEIYLGRATCREGGEIQQGFMMKHRVEKETGVMIHSVKTKIVEEQGKEFVVDYYGIIND